MMRKPLRVVVAFLCLVILCQEGNAGCPMTTSLRRRTLKQAPPSVTPLQYGFYDQTCPQLNQIVADKIGYWTAADTLTPGKVLRIFFHDCISQGCDASILLNSTATNLAEKDATISQTLDKFFVIDDIKAAAEAVCPGIVSCADIIALAAVNSVRQAGGPNFAIELGRRDGTTSYAAAATASVPPGTSNVDTLLAALAIVGLNQTDLVVLSGAHTIGQVHCTNIVNRFQGNSPFPDAAFGQELYNYCTQNGAAPDFTTLNLKTFLDIQSPSIFDTSYYVNLIVGRGVLTSDQDLFNDPRTQPLVQALASNQTFFYDQFVQSMRKMGRINVLTGTQGIIRQQCWV